MTIAILFLGLTIFTAPLFSVVRSAPVRSYDQQQTGDLNVRIDLEDIQVIALLNSGLDDFGEYDYAYDYSDFTIKPIQSTPSTSSVKPWNTWPTNAPVSSTTPNSQELTAEIVPIPSPDTQPEKQPETEPATKPESGSVSESVTEASIKPGVTAENQPSATSESESDAKPVNHSANEPDNQSELASDGKLEADKIEKQPESSLGGQHTEPQTQEKENQGKPEASSSQKTELDSKLEEANKGSAAKSDGEVENPSKIVANEDGKKDTSKGDDVTTEAAQRLKSCNQGYSRDANGRCRRQNRNPVSFLRPFGIRFGSKAPRTGQQGKNAEN